MSHRPTEDRALSVVSFPGRPGPSGVCTLAAAVDRYLDSIPAATTRAGYDDTLPRLIDVADWMTAPTFPRSADAQGCSRDAPPITRRHRSWRATTRRPLVVGGRRWRVGRIGWSGAAAPNACMLGPATCRTSLPKGFSDIWFWLELLTVQGIGGLLKPRLNLTV